MLLLPTLGYGFGFDHGFMQYIGWAALHGRWPYTDSWDTALPGAILLHMGVLGVGGVSVLAIRTVDVAIQVANAGILFALTRRLSGPRAGLYASATYAIAYTAGTYYHTAQRDGFLVPLLLLALWGVWRYLEDGSRRSPLFWAAFSAGLSCLFRPTYALVIALAAACLALRPLPTAPSRRAMVRDACVFALIAATPLLAWVTIYAAVGRFRSVVEVLTLLETVYQHLERQSLGAVFLGFVTFAPLSLWAGTILSPFALSWRTHRPELRALTVLLVGCVLVRVWESKGYRYQYWPTFACLAIYAGVGWDWAANAAARVLGLSAARTGAFVTTVVAALLIIQLGRTGLRRYPQMVDALRPAPNDSVRLHRMIADSDTQAELARYLGAHTQAGDEIQLWGPETLVLYAAGRLSSTRFLDPFTFLCPSGGGLTLFSDCGTQWNKPIQVQFRRELVSSLTTRPPRYIAAHYANGSLAVTEGACIAPDLPELRDLLDSRYVREATFGNWSAFRRHDG